MQRLEQHLRRIDGRGYGAYKDIKGRYTFPDFTLHVEYVQGDPFASPSRLRVVIPPETAQLPGAVLESSTRRIACADFILRNFAAEAERRSQRRGSGKSGLIAADRPGQEILERSGCDVASDGTLTLRFYVGLPAKGRRIRGRAAATLLLEDLPAMVRGAATADALDADALKAHVLCVEDSRALRALLDAHDLVAFIANGALLPRSAGDTDAPMARAEATPFQSPPELEVTLTAPNAGPIRGCGVPRGITLICGGGYHGKSTLLSAIQSGIYDHIPGDGREQVVTVPAALKLRAEDGRRVCGVDISAFIDNLPHGRSTADFTSDDASGSTSQAAAVMEALELGAELLLLDEDTCATNFMIRDRRMQALVDAEREPITPFLDRVRSLHDDLDVSVVLVMGGSGDYFDVADTVLVMDAYRPRDATERARAIASDLPTGRASEATGPVAEPPERVPLPDSFDPSRGRKPVKVRSRGTRTIQFGTYDIDLDALEQLVSPSQTRTLADAIVFALKQRIIDGERSLSEILDALAEHFDARGPLAVSRFEEANRAEVRAIEIGCAINRLRSLAVRQRRDS